MGFALVHKATQAYDRIPLNTKEGVEIVGRLKGDIENKRAFIVEVLTPRGTDISKTIELAMNLKRIGINVVSITDTPLGRARMSPWAVSHNLVEMGLDVLMHFTRISRNLLRIHADLLGIHALGIRNLLVLSGDDPKEGDYPESTVLNDITTEDLIRLIRSMNLGYDLKGRRIKPNTDFLIGAVFNPFIEREIDRAKKKLENGADFLISQPVFKLDDLPEFHLDSSKIVISLVLFRNKKHFRLFAGVPGVRMKDGFIENMEKLDDDGVRMRSIESASEIVRKLRNEFAGFYIIGVTTSSWKMVGELLLKV